LLLYGIKICGGGNSFKQAVEAIVVPVRGGIASGGNDADFDVFA
jgi:hypothetical protein